MGSARWRTPSWCRAHVGQRGRCFDCCAAHRGCCWGKRRCPPPENAPSHCPLQSRHGNGTARHKSAQAVSQFKLKLGMGRALRALVLPLTSPYAYAYPLNKNSVCVLARASTHSVARAPEPFKNATMKCQNVYNDEVKHMHVMCVHDSRCEGLEGP